MHFCDNLVAHPLIILIRVPWKSWIQKYLSTCTHVLILSVNASVCLAAILFLYVNSKKVEYKACKCLVICFLLSFLYWNTALFVSLKALYTCALFGRWCSFAKVHPHFLLHSGGVLLLLNVFLFVEPGESWIQDIPVLLFSFLETLHTCAFWGFLFFDKVLTILLLPCSCAQVWHYWF